MSVLGAFAFAGLVSAQSGISFLAGAFAITLNFGILAFSWHLIFQKKLIALAIFLIVIKYAILGIIIYHLIRSAEIQPMWLMIGVSSFLVSILVYIQRQNGI